MKEKDNLYTFVYQTEKDNNQYSIGSILFDDYYVTTTVNY